MPKMRIKELRTSKKLTQERLGELLNVKRTAVAMWETGEAMPRADKLPVLARIFDCEISELFEKSVGA